MILGTERRSRDREGGETKGEDTEVDAFSRHTLSSPFESSPMTDVFNIVTHLHRMYFN